MDTKKEYSSPRFVEYGRVDDLTQGFFGSKLDWGGYNDDCGLICPPPSTHANSN